MKFSVIPIPTNLQDVVENIRIAEHSGGEIDINVCLNGLPGIVFQHQNGYSPIESISTRSGVATDIPTLYVYGQMTEPGVMHHRKGAFTTIQVVLKSHALQSLLGMNALALTNQVVALSEFSAAHLNLQMLEAPNEQERLRLLLDFLLTQREKVERRDCLIEESLCLIQQNIGCITVKYLLDNLYISERHFERRFSQAVGLSPHFYIRVKRFNAALCLMQSQRFVTLTTVAHDLNYFDQSHFIRDMKAFSGITPKTLSQKAGDFDHRQGVYAYF